MDREIFDMCVKLKECGLYQSRKPDAYYYVTPNIVVRMDDLSDLRNPYSHFSDFVFQDIIFQPKLEDLFDCVDVNQLNRTVTSGWMAYQDNPGEGAVNFRGQGETIWLAVAKLFVTIVEYNKSLIPDVDTGTLDESNSKQL
jgi:hypothetical protein